MDIVVESSTVMVVLSALLLTGYHEQWRPWAEEEGRRGMCREYKNGTGELAHSFEIVRRSRQD